jgi:lysophospholipase L1-like esterase
MKKVIVPSILIFMAFFLSEKKKITIWLCGDSTMSIKEKRVHPETGWGMPFAYFWDSTVTIENLARNGRSTRSFREEKIWDRFLNKGGEGDFVFIQFGHNDEVPAKKTYTTETEFKSNLKKFISETKIKRAMPVLLTPVARRKFDAQGKIEGTHDVYSQIVRDVANEESVYLIDLDIKSQQLYQQMGVEHSKLLFLHLEPGEHPNYPNGKEDNTHFSELGARLIAQIVLSEIRSLIPGLSDRIVQPMVK